jgi:hypothetical protein
LIVKYKSLRKSVVNFGWGDAIFRQKKKEKKEGTRQTMHFYLQSRELICKDLTFVCLLCLMNLHNHHDLIQSLPKKKATRKNQPQKKKE